MNIQFIKILVVKLCFLILLGNIAFADGPNIPTDVSIKDFCPNEPDAFDREFDHVMILIDRTSWLESEQKNWIKNTIFNQKFLRSYRPYTKFSVMFIDNKSVQEQKLIYTKCRPKSGKTSKRWDDEIYSNDENKTIVTAWHKKKLKGWDAINNNIGTTVSSDNSFIFETIIRVLRDPSIGFESEQHKNREIIIVSDLMQHSKEFSFYRICNATTNIRQMNKCPSFQSVIDKNSKLRDYIKFTKPKDTKNLVIKLKFMNFKHESNEEINTSLINLWGDYFRKIGIDIPSNQLDWVERQLNFS